MHGIYDMTHILYVETMTYTIFFLPAACCRMLWITHNAGYLLHNIYSIGRMNSPLLPANRINFHIYDQDYFQDDIHPIYRTMGSLLQANRLRSMIFFTIRFSPQYTEWIVIFSWQIVSVRRHATKIVCDTIYVRYTD